MVILRLSRPTTSLTAAVFEELFEEHVGAAFSLRHADSAAWCRALLGPAGASWSFDEAASRLASTLRDADFVAPNYEATLLAPLFLALRNRARLRARLMLVAHAPGAWAFEWALMGRLLVPGDLIVAPSRSAADLIAYLNASLVPFVKVIPHPMSPLNVRAPADGRVPRIVSLGRIDSSKLLHRQIEAIELLRRRGRRLPVLDIAGAPQTPDASAYQRSLEAKVRRLGLETNVRFIGAIRGSAAKAQLLSRAAALVNLSVTIEESFGKAPIEALGCGVPVLSTRWNGLPETIGECGVLLPVDCIRPGVPADVSAERVADGLQQLLEAPPSADACRTQAARFAPSVVVPRYREALEAARTITAKPEGGWSPDPRLDAAAAVPEGGLLSATAPLTAMSWGQLFSAYVACCDDLRRSWDGDAHGTTESRLRAILLQGTRGPIERFLAQPDQIPPAPPIAQVIDGDFTDRVAAAAVQPAAPSTRVACLVHLWQAGRLDALRSGLLSLEGYETPAVHVLRAEAAYLADDLTEAFALACDALDLHCDDSITAFRLRQVARIARAAGVPARALPLLREWLERFPDSPDSGALWLDRSVNAAHAGGRGHAAEASAALDRARALLDESPVLGKVESLVASAAATAAVSG